MGARSPFGRTVRIGQPRRKIHTGRCHLHQRSGFQHPPSWPKTPSCVGADATAGSAVVRGSHSRTDDRGQASRAACGKHSATGDRDARKNAVAKLTKHTKDFVVAEAGFKGCLEDEIRSRVVGVIAERVVKTAGVAERADEEVVEGPSGTTAVPVVGNARGDRDQSAIESRGHVAAGARTPCGLAGAHVTVGLP